MNKTEIMNKFSRTVNKVSFKVKKHSPEILVAAGVVGVVASTVLACKATRKLDDIIDSAKHDIDTINEFHEHPELIPEGKEPYTEEVYKKDLAITYVRSGVEVAKLYAPAVALGVASITCICASHRILSKRNAALAAAYATIDKGFKEYRNRVVERFGTEMDKELKYNIKAKEFEETVVDGKGKEKVVKKSADIVDPNVLTSDYARFFDSSSPEWEDNPEYNLTFLKLQQNHANDMLKARGHLFLNEVYDMLGLERSKAGQIVGWVFNPDAPEGDNYVDFGIYECKRESNRRFVNGYEPVVLLDFNVDGDIYAKM